MEIPQSLNDFIAALLPAIRNPEVTADLRATAYSNFPAEVIDAAATDVLAPDAAVALIFDHVGKCEGPEGNGEDDAEADMGIAETLRLVIEDLRSGQVDASAAIRGAVKCSCARSWIEETNMPRAVAVAIMPSLLGPRPRAIDLDQGQVAAILLAIRVFAHRQIVGRWAVDAIPADFGAMQAVLGHLADDLGRRAGQGIKAPEIGVLWRLANEMRLAAEPREGAVSAGLVH